MMNGARSEPWTWHGDMDLGTLHPGLVFERCGKNRNSKEKSNQKWEKDKCVIMRKFVLLPHKEIERGGRVAWVCRVHPSCRGHGNLAGKGRAAFKRSGHEDRQFPTTKRAYLYSQR